MAHLSSFENNGESPSDLLMRIQELKTWHEHQQTQNGNETSFIEARTNNIDEDEQCGHLQPMPNLDYGWSPCVEYVPSSPGVAYVPSSPGVDYVPSSPGVNYVSSPRVDYVSSPRVDYVSSSPGVDYVSSSPGVDYVPSSPGVEYVPSSPGVGFNHSLSSKNNSVESNFVTNNDGKNSIIRSPIIKSANVVDNMPIISKRKPFQVLLQEKLETVNNLNESEKEIQPIKRKFLRKGEGLKKSNWYKYGKIRIKKKSGHESNQEIKTNNINKVVSNDNASSTPIQKNSDTPKKSPYKSLDFRSPKRVLLSSELPMRKLVLSKPKLIPSDENLSMRKFCNNPPPNLKLQQLPKNDVLEVEELSAFEHLEQLADDSSFSSNNSIVLKLLKRGIDSPIFQSTPTKRLIFPSKNDQSVHDNQNEANVKDEVIRLIKSYRSPNNDLADVNVDDLLTQCKIVLSEEGWNEPLCDDEVFTILKLVLNNQLPGSSILDNLTSFNDSKSCSFQTPLTNNRPHVHFRPEGVEVLEYEDTDTEGTLTDIISIDGDSEFKQCTQNISTKAFAQKEVLQFSPPKIPKNSASHHIWSIFCENKKEKKEESNKPPTNKTIFKESSSLSQFSKVNQPAYENDIEAHKILLLAKMKELEEEVAALKERQVRIDNHEKGLLEERFQLDKERKEFMNFKMEESLKFKRNCEQFRIEQNNKSSKLTNSIQLKVLKEENKLLQEDKQLLKDQLAKKESLHQFNSKKLKDNIKKLENDNSSLNEKLKYLSNLEKENFSLKHQLDRLKLGNSKKQLKNNFEKSIEKVIAPPISDRSASPDCPAHEVYPQKKIEFNKEKSKSIKPSSISNEEVSETNDNDNLEIISGVQRTSSPQSVLSDSTVNVLNDGSKEIIYANGNRKIVKKDGFTTMQYFNGDVKEVFPDKIKYVYNSDKTSHTTFASGKQLFEFLDGTIETIFADGSSEVMLADKSRRYLSSDGVEVCEYVDGTVTKKHSNGTKMTEFNNGQKEIHSSDGIKVRIFPDGTRRSMFPDGTLKTEYKNGRIRIKDKDGNLISDTGNR